MNTCHSKWADIAWLQVLLLLIPVGAGTLKSLPISLPSTGVGLAYGDSEDLNCLSIEQWVKLPSIGPKLGAAIVRRRELNGGFTSVDELSGVSGIGDKTLRKISVYLNVSQHPDQLCGKEKGT